MIHLDDYIIEKLKLNKKSISLTELTIDIVENYPASAKNDLDNIITILDDKLNHIFDVEISSKIIHIKKCIIEYLYDFKDFIVKFYSNEDATNDEKSVFLCFSDRELRRFIQYKKEYLNAWNDNINRLNKTYVKLLS